VENGPNKCIKGGSKESNGHVMSRALQELLPSAPTIKLASIHLRLWLLLARLPKGQVKKQAQVSATGKRRPHDENDPSDTSRRPRESAHIPAVNSRTSTEENEIEHEQQNPTDKLMQKYTELQGECSITL
jgi:hypothetical protein